jgi:hypothetical protein
MGSIQAVQSSPSVNRSVSVNSSKQAAPKQESTESAQYERMEVRTGRQESGEAQAQQVGGRFSATA